MRPVLVGAGLALAGCRFAPGPFDLDDPRATRCTSSEDHVACDFVTAPFHMGLARREVHLQHPTGTAPDGGWPAVVLFQGSLVSAVHFWEGDADDAFGGLHQARLVRDLLDAGYAVITPEARLDGASFWQTNVYPTSIFWKGCEDDDLVHGLLDAIDAGDLGPIDPDALFAGGISSGGYMTSRLAKAWPGRFRALAIQSASWATCAGPVCVLPAKLPEDHPPTLFLHGGDDLVVPVGTMEPYAERLAADGVDVEVEIDPDAGHAWLESAPERVVGWFDGQR